MTEKNDLNEGDYSQTNVNGKEEDQKQICSNCGIENPKSNLFCRKCGSPFVEKVNCRNCGTEMPVYNSFCSNCGAVLRQRTSTSKTQVQESVSTSQTVLGRTHPTPYQSYQRVTVIDPNDPIYQEQLKKARQQQNNTIGLVVGIILASLGGLGLIGTILLLIIAPTVLTESFLAEVGVTAAALYGSMISTYMLPAILMVASGMFLIIYKPDNSAWKGLYFGLRYIFVGLVGIMAFSSLISIIGWMFYNPNTKVSGALPFWMFTTFAIPVTETSILTIIILETIVFLACIILLLFPTIPQLVKYFKSKKEQPLSDHKNSNSDIVDLDNEDINAKIIDLELESNNDMEATFRKFDLKFSEVEKRKGNLPIIFYIIKKSPLIGSMELFAVSYLFSFILIFILGPFISEGDSGIGISDPFVVVINLFWAGIFEELSFRLILIGVPLIFVVMVRYLRQIKSTNSDKKLRPIDIGLALRGRVKTIGIPEWILISISALLFGFAHWERWTGSWGWWKIIQASVSGLFMSYAFVKYGIESSIFIHVVNNVVSSLVILTAEINGQWIGFFASIVISGLLLLGFMKSVSTIVSAVLWNKIRKEKQNELLKQQILAE